MNDSRSHALARPAAPPPPSPLGTGVTPNRLTTLRRLTGLAACPCLAVRPLLALRGGLPRTILTRLDRADDALSLPGPAAWFGLLMPVPVGAVIGTGIMALVILVRQPGSRAPIRQLA